MDKKRRIIISIVLVLMVITMACVGIYYWYNNTYFVSTEDAKVTGDLVKVSSQISGKILELNFEEGQKVVKDQILGRIEMQNLPDSSVEMSVIRATISGIIVKKQGTVGEIAAPGQVLGMIIDPQKLYINANIEETKLNSLRIGQKVEIFIDQLEGNNIYGKVMSIGLATNSTFSLIPSSSGSTFTKVVQKIPVKIDMDKHEAQMLPGTNASIKIHIK